MSVAEIPAKTLTKEVRPNYRHPPKPLMTEISVQSGVSQVKPSNALA